MDPPLPLSQAKIIHSGRSARTQRILCFTAFFSLTISVFGSRAGVAVLNLLDMFVLGFRAGVTIPGEDAGLIAGLSDV